MEDGSNGVLSEVEVDHVKNGVVSPIMANFPEGTVAEAKEDTPKVNGETNIQQTPNQEDYSSESDALVIDESAPKQKAHLKRRRSSKPSTSDGSPRNADVIPHHFNPYFNESLFELSQQHHNPQQEGLEQSDAPQLGVGPKFHKHKRLKNKNSPKLREYAQYLGLQPTVQFKCSRCGRAGFESLTTLNEHIVQCTDEPSTVPQVQDSSSSSFKLTRKVFLCSACGTYYENWNLYLHMLEVHRRYLCLYCLGMFSVLDDLCLHIQSRHNLEPGHKETLDEFFSAYNEPCYISCCTCSKLFNEQDNFFYHTCARREQLNKNNKTANNQKLANKILKPIKQQIRPEDHVTGDSAGDISERIHVNGDSVLENSDGGSERENGDEKLDNLVSTETDEIDRSFEDGQIHSENPDKSVEILYSSDSELDFRGFSPISEPEALSIYNEELNLIENNESKELPDESMEESMEVEEPVETRKVPKLSLKLKPGSFPEIEQHVNSDDGERLYNDIEQIESENEVNVSDRSEDKSDDQVVTNEEPEMQIAGPDIGIVELKLEQPLDKFDIRVLLQKCLNATAHTCIYCNHARKIAVNGKQLGLHAIAEHRFSAVVSSITAEELIPESFVSRIRESLPGLENVFFNLESSPSDEAVTFSHVFECFQCRYSTSVHKELYLHNRKSHAKNLLLCIMCKSNFYSYSELICHLCPGVYVLDYDVQFRCCMCVSDDLPSAFRLMVHLRKRHHVCDVCLEMCHNQYRLSNHVWKHKLHHFCYRCGIAYRNKPDITRHLFWKHGTESVLCKKCLQKKWPHVYHFCVPPANFQCEECNLTFSRAVSLKVHKRLHSDEKPHGCTVDDCKESFISKKLLAKHELRHREPLEEEKMEVVEEPAKENADKENDDVEATGENSERAEKKEVKPKVDVYDLPELNLSESDSSDSETETKKEEALKESEKLTEDAQEIVVENDDGIDKDLTLIHEFGGIETDVTAPEETTTAQEDSGEVPEDIWDNFKNYQANKEKFDHLLTEVEKTDQVEVAAELEEEPLTWEVALRDHDYCVDPNNKPDVSFTEVKPDLSQSVDHDYCSANDPVASKEVDQAKPTEVVSEEKVSKSPRKRSNSSSSDSSSGSDSSSCSCGSNCSCTSTSGSSSSTSDSSDSDSSTEEGRKRQQIRRDRRRQRSKNVDKEAENKVDVVTTDNLPAITIDTPIRESDLETTESETDEEFYDKQPQKLAKKILEEKRNQLLSGIAPSPNGSFPGTSRPATPNIPEVEAEAKPRKRSKSKKKKKKKSERRDAENVELDAASIPISYYQYYQPPNVAPLTLTLSRNSPVPSPSAKLPPASLYPKLNSEPEVAREDSDLNLRASKRRRVPNKFYGYSSDEEETPLPKWRKNELPLAPPQHSSMTVPPITIKTTPPPTQQPKVQPFSIRTTAHPGQMKVHTKRMPAIRLKQPKTEDVESEAESNDSSSEGRNVLKVDPGALYCYCKCPYDEVSEMIGCDSRDCTIEWFHFECVGIMVPPKGHWYCPECRKKRQQKGELLKLKGRGPT